MKLADNVAISESGFIFDPNSGETFSVNNTGRSILKLLSQGKSQQEIEEKILDEYEIEKNTLNRYLDDFIYSLKRYNLIEDSDHE